MAEIVFYSSRQRGWPPPRGRAAKRAWRSNAIACAAAVASSLSFPALAPASGDRSEQAAVVAVLTLPEPGQVVSNVLRGSADLSVTGTAAGEGLTRWVLDSGRGAAPSAWTRIASGTVPVSGGELGVWRTGALANGIYSLRLRAWVTAAEPAVASRTVTVGNFSADQGALQFNPSTGATQTYTSTVPFRLAERLVIKNQHGLLVRTLVDGERDAGTYVDAWDGRDDAGELVPDGPYFYVAEASVDGRTLTWDLSRDYLDNYFESTDGLAITAFDPFNNQPLIVRYTTAAPGLTTVSLFNRGLQSFDCDQPVEKALCIVNRMYQESGSHEFVWSGLDHAGAYRGNDYTLLSVTVIRDRFARNAVIVHGTKPTIRNLTVTPPIIASGPAAAVVSFDLQTYGEAPASVTVAFVNQSSRSALKTVVLPAQRPGRGAVHWDGKADNGAWVAPGAYTIDVLATDGIGNRAEGQLFVTVRR